MDETLDRWFEKDEKPKRESDVSRTLYDEAVSLRDKRKSKEALVLINVAIEHDGENQDCRNLKGLILQDLSRYTESKTAFDEAIDLNPENSEVTENKVRMLYEWANSINDKAKALEIIGEAIEIAEGVEGFDTFRLWYLKGSILDCLSSPIEARRCYMIAEGMFDEVRELDGQMKMIAESRDVLINITGTQFYFGFEPFEKGTVVDLIAENDNEHDPDAIRVEIAGETVGYVANSDYTLMEGIKSASDLRDLKFTGAEVLFIFFENYVIARVISQ